MIIWTLPAFKSILLKGSAVLKPYFDVANNIHAKADIIKLAILFAKLITQEFEEGESITLVYAEGKRERRSEVDITISAVSPESISIELSDEEHISLDEDHHPIDRYIQGLVINEVIIKIGARPRTSAGGAAQHQPIPTPNETLAAI